MEHCELSRHQLASFGVGSLAPVFRNYVVFERPNCFADKYDSIRKSNYNTQHLHSAQHTMAWSHESCECEERSLDQRDGTIGCRGITANWDIRPDFVDHVVAEEQDFECQGQGGMENRDSNDY